MKEWIILAAATFGLSVGQLPAEFRDCETASALTLRIEACSRIIDGGSANAETLAIAHWYRGSAYYDAKKTDEALADHDKAILLDPDFIMAYVTRGTIFEREGELDRALADFHKALSMSENAAGYVLRAGVYLAKGETEKALADYTAAVELDETFAPGHAGRGKAHLDLQDFDAAILDFDKALALAPENAASLANRGVAHAGKGDLPRAFADYDAALRVDPANIIALAGRGSAFLEAEDLERAIADINRLEEALTPAANDLGLDFARFFMALHLPRSLMERAYAYVRSGQTELALADYEALIKFAKPPDPAFYGSRARAFDNLADHDRAISDYSKALELNSADKSFHYDIGRVHFREGDFAAAVENIKRYSDPDTYGMLWLFLAQSRNGEDGTKDLAATAAGADKKWPYPVIELYLGKSAPEQVYAAAADDGQRCEADFYVGQWDILKGRKAEAKAKLESAVAKCWKTFIEYPGAVAELKRMN